jgi:sarcosine oxidase subunit gamma
MADPAPALAAARREPFDDLPPITVRNRLSIDASGPASRFVLRGPSGAAGAVLEVLGLSSPGENNRATSQGTSQEGTSQEGTSQGAWSALRLGPDEWLLIGPDGEGLPVLEPGPCSLVDVSHRNVGLTVSGALATEVLSSGVMLDLDIETFPVDMATRTLFTKAEIVLWRRAPDLFHIEVWRSFAVYLRALLAEAAREHARPDRA